ncbi:hypothetical protein PUR22_05000 [Mycolicibacterium porcinum]|uniref:hypothetical protein n=1 Tax=Mycolicibacterium porcinum TaxID=39693 RepID=UPI0031F9B0F3
MAVGEKVLGLDDIAALKKPSDGIVSPPECAATPPDRADNVLGAKMVNVNATKDGVHYVISAQEATDTSKPHTGLRGRFPRRLLNHYRPIRQRLRHHHTGTCPSR